MPSIVLFICTTRFHSLAVLSALLLSESATAGDRQAWLVESKGFLRSYSAEIILDLDKGKYWESQNDMEGLGFDLTKLATVNGKFDLAAGGQLAVDEINQKIALTVRPEMLPANTFDFRASLESMKPQPAISGGFVNYDIRASAENVNSVTSLFDANKFLLRYHSTVARSFQEASPTFLP